MGGAEIGIVVGVGGRYCAGKGVVTTLFLDHGYRVIDVDAIGHEALQSKAARIVECFGCEMALDNGTIDRKRLGAIVFSNPPELARLEAIVHPWMRRRVIERIAALQPSNIVIDAALIYYLQLNKLCDVVIWIRARSFRRLCRVIKRDRTGIRHALRVMRAQKHVKLTRGDADIYVIDNNMSKEQFVRKCEEQLATLW